MARTVGQCELEPEPTAESGGAGAADLALRWLMDRYPEARLVAVTTDASVRVVAIPEKLGIGPGHTTISRGSLIHLVDPCDQPAVARLWSRARTVGYSSGVIHLADPPVSGALHFLDLTGSYGLMLVVFAEGADAELPELAGMFPEPPLPGLAHVSKDGGARIVAADLGVAALLGWSPQELIGRRSLELVHPDDQELAIDSWVRMLEYPGASPPVRLRHCHRDGRWVWVQVRNHNRLADPEHRDVVAEMTDVTEEVAAQEAVRARQQLLEQLTETLPIGLFHADLQGRLLYLNRRLTEITGLAVGSRLREWTGLTDPRFLARIDGTLCQAALGSASESVVEAPDAAGYPRYYSVSIRPLSDRYGMVSSVTGAVEDVTRTLAERRELELRAATDALTGCLNRSAVLALLQDALDEIAPHGPPDGAAVIFVDVDRLKALNDGLGHQAGDALLTEVARRLRAAVRSSDAVGRYGGDEFVVLARHVSSTDHALTVARWLAARTLHPMTIEGQLVDIRFSLGVAWTGAAGVQGPWLVRQADAAMYRSKQAGRCEPVLA